MCRQAGELHPKGLAGRGAPLPRVHLLELGLALAQKQVVKRKSLLLALRLMVRECHLGRRKLGFMLFLLRP